MMKKATKLFLTDPTYISHDAWSKNKGFTWNNAPVYVAHCPEGSNNSDFFRTLNLKNYFIPHLDHYSNKITPIYDGVSMSDISNQTSMEAIVVYACESGKFSQGLIV